MVHADVRYVMAQSAARNTKQLADYLAGLLKQLARGGAEIDSIPAFSPQVCAGELAAITRCHSSVSSIPFQERLNDDGSAGLHCSVPA